LEVFFPHFADFIILQTYFEISLRKCISFREGVTNYFVVRARSPFSILRQTILTILKRNILFWSQKQIRANNVEREILAARNCNLLYAHLGGLMTHGRIKAIFLIACYWQGLLLNPLVKMQ